MMSSSSSSSNKRLQIELRLIPTPGSKPEFLAIVESKDDQDNGVLMKYMTSNSTPNDQKPMVLCLEGYTRDSWADTTSSANWKSFQVQSIDGRQKLPGFVKYLRERKKTAFGRLAPPGGDKVWVVPHKQMNSQTLTCRIASINQIPNCPLKPIHMKKATATRQPPQTKPSTAAAAPPSSSATNTNPKKKKGFGLLGNLVSAQKRTNHQVQAAAVVKGGGSSTSATKSQPTTNNVAAGGSGTSAASAVNTSTMMTSTNPSLPASPTTELRTAGQVLADFRQAMEQEMLDFDTSGETCLKVKIDVASKLKLMSPEEQQSGRITMEILKYIVYEQAEEVNEEWIAHKEPSEFQDEAVVAIYKEGTAPPEVLEDINKADLPDEVRGQQRAIQEQQQKEQIRKQQKLIAFKQAQALKKQKSAENEDDFATLNTQKRDRRTIEDFQRGNGEGNEPPNKQQRVE